jgi:hypothetical protein
LKNFSQAFGRPRFAAALPQHLRRSKVETIRPKKRLEKMYATSARDESKRANDNFFAPDQLFL